VTRKRKLVLFHSRDRMMIGRTIQSSRIKSHQRKKVNRLGRKSPNPLRLRNPVSFSHIFALAQFMAEVLKREGKELEEKFTSSLQKWKSYQEKRK